MIANAVQSETPSLRRQNPKRHSSWKKLIRICGWVIRFITNVRRSVDEKIVGEFLPSEVKDAEKLVHQKRTRRKFCRRV